MKKLIISLLFGAMALTGAAQEKAHQVGEISVINYGDGRLFRQMNDDKTPCENDTEVYRKIYHSNGKLRSVAEKHGGSWETLESYDSDGNKE